MATTLDSHMEILFETENYDHEGLWNIVSWRAVEFAVAKQAREAGAKVSPGVSGVQSVAHGVFSSASKRLRTGFMAASMVHAPSLSRMPRK